jgi:hypothetical protein
MDNWSRSGEDCDYKTSQKVRCTHGRRISLWSTVQRTDAHVFCSANSLCQSALSPCRETSFLASVYFAHLRQEAGQQIGILALDERVETELVEGVIPTRLGRARPNSLPFYCGMDCFESGIVRELVWLYML